MLRRANDCLLIVPWVLIGLLAPATSVAQTSSDHDEEARTLFQAGTMALDDGRFEEALQHFQRAYELSGRAPLLYNIGVTAERLHRNREALEAYEAFLESGSTARPRAEVERRIELLREAIRNEGEPSEDVAPAPEASGTSGAREEPTAQPAPSGGGVNLLWTFVAGGFAAVTGGVAIGTWVAATSAYDGLRDSCGSVGCSDQQIADSGVETLVLVTNIFFVTSMVAVAATGGLLAFELLSGDDGGDATATTAELRVGLGRLDLRVTY